MEIDWIHRPDTLNLCFNALDRHVIRGSADQVAVRVDRVSAGRTEHTFARLLEEVAAFGGVLRACGVEPGTRVLSRLPMGSEGLVAALATARVGGVHVVADPYDDAAGALAAHRPAVVLSEGSDSMLAAALAVAASPPGAAIWRGALPPGQDLAWDVLMGAGRADPAAVAELAVTADAFVIGDRTLTIREALADDDGEWPLDAIGTLVAAGVVLLSVP